MLIDSTLSIIYIRPDEHNLMIVVLALFGIGCCLFGSAMVILILSTIDRYGTPKFILKEGENVESYICGRDNSGVVNGGIRDYSTFSNQNVRV